MQRHLPLLLCALSIYSHAQTVPSELLDMSIEELLQAHIIDDSRSAQTSSPWRLTYTFQSGTFKDYREGTRKKDSLSYLWKPQAGPRQASQYIAVTPEIRQEVHAITLTRDLSEATAVSVLVSWIEQSTDHLAVIPGWTDFTTHSEDMGDTKVSVSHQFAQGLTSAWTLRAGVSLPTGSINERATTPAGPGSLLPYTMQMGSGTTDVSLGLSVMKEESSFFWGADADTTVRRGRNDHDYRLGDNVSLAGWAYLTQWANVQPGVQFRWTYTGAIVGADPDIPGPNADGLYPTPILNPDNYGGHRIDGTLFLRYVPSGSDWHLDLQYTLPLHQDLNGPQVGLDNSLGVSMGYRF